MANVDQGTSQGAVDMTAPGTTQLAQAHGEPIGQISSASSPVHVTHTDGSTEDLSVGGQVYANDVVRTDADGAVGITFVDGTEFSLGGGAEMRIDKLIYDPSGSDNSLALSVVQGAFVFVTGGIAGAPGEGMTVGTPAGSIGVRGTSVGGHYGQGPEGWVIALLKDADGHVGKVVVYNGKGEVVLDEVFESTNLLDFNTPPSTPIILTKEQIEALFGGPLDQLPDIQLQNDLLNQHGELDVQTAAGGSGPGGRENTGHFFRHGPGDGILGGLQDHGAINATGLDVNADTLDLPLPNNRDQFSTPIWSISGTTDSEVTEGGTALYTVYYTGSTLGPGQKATITVATGAGTNPSISDAISGTDYTALSTVLTFTAGQTAQTVVVHTIDDTLVEGTEDYSVQISGPSAGTINAGTVPTDIVDNDASNVQWNIAGQSAVNEGSNALYTVSYTGATLAAGQTAFITIQTNSGTATEGTDFDSRDGTILTFTGGGATSQTLTVHADADTVIRSEERGVVHV
jgi:hypothetical protein